MSTSVLGSGPKPIRYYRVDPSYDKRVYVNSSKSIAQTTFAFVCFYAWNWIMTWGMFEWGMIHAEEFSTFACIEFLLTLLGLAVMIVLGGYANHKNYYKEFLVQKISEMRSEREEIALKKKKDEEHLAQLRAIEQSQGIKA